MTYSSYCTGYSDRFASAFYLNSSGKIYNQQKYGTIKTRSVLKNCVNKSNTRLRI